MLDLCSEEIHEHHIPQILGNLHPIQKELTIISKKFGHENDETITKIRKTIPICKYREILKVCREETCIQCQFSNAE